MAGRLVAVELDAETLPAGLLEAEREAAIRDIVADNLFRPGGRDGAFRLRLSAGDGKLVLDIADAEGGAAVRHILSLRPLARVIRDYFLICESHRAALLTLPAGRIEAIDMGRRGVHNEGAEALIARLAGKVEVDFETARRLFTLVCVLCRKG